MANDLTLALRLIANSSGLKNGLTQASGSVKRFGNFARNEFNSLKSTFSSLSGQLASIGVSLSVAQQVIKAAKLDQSLIQVGQTAGASKAQVAALRAELFKMAQETGKPVEDLQQGFNNLIQSGMSWDAARSTIKDINIAMAVTGSQADTLSGALSVAGQAFDFDLSKPGLALKLLDKMTVAGRLGNAELEGLSDVFSRIGVNAKAAGMNFDQTLAFTETLSLVERQPERLATLADSTLRLFNNANYRKTASQATGVQFFNKDGTRRAAAEVLQDIKTQYDKLKTDQGRDAFMSAAFGKADLDTIKGMRTLLSGDMLVKSKQFGQTIEGASGTLKKDLQDALDNSVSQTGRLGAALRQAADDFSKPINETLSNTIRWSMDKKENGGLGMSGKDMLLGGTGAVLGTLAAARYGSMGIKAIAGKFGSVGAGVATGKALEAAAGITPVYVTNFAQMAGSSAASITADVAASTAAAAAAPGLLKTVATGAKWIAYSTLPEIAALGTGAMAASLAMVTAAGALGYGAGTLINKAGFEGSDAQETLGGTIATMLSWLGNKEAQQALEINLHLDGEKITQVVTGKIDRTARRS